VGRLDRSSFAYNIQNQHQVLLKDSWHVILDNIKPEGEIYKWFHDGKVPNIPSYELSMDIGNDTHKSRTHETINKVKGNVTHWKLVPHRHYRLVLSTVGRRLEKFKSTSEVVNAMYAALKGEVTIFLAVCLHNLTHVIAHEATCHAGILHRDISPGNILIFGKDEKDPDNLHDSAIEGRILINWDLSKLIDSYGKQSVARQYTCTVS
jgi:hypothetical protein